MAIRQGMLLPLNFGPRVWRAMVGLAVRPEDLAAVATRFVGAAQQLMSNDSVRVAALPLSQLFLFCFLVLAFMFVFVVVVSFAHVHVCCGHGCCVFGRPRRHHSFRLMQLGDWLASCSSTLITSALCVAWDECCVVCCSTVSSVVRRLVLIVPRCRR